MFVLSNLAISIDGKIAPASREHYPIGTPYDRELMAVIRAKSECVIMGASTIRAYKRPCAIKGSDVVLWNAIVSRSLDGFDSAWPFFTSPKIKRVLFYTENVDHKIIEEFSKSSTVIHIDKTKPTALQMISALEKLGVKNLLVEGGGHLMWDFVSENLIDEYYLTLTPKVIGGINSPTLVEGSGFKAQDILNLKLLESRVVGDEIYLRYGKTEVKG